MLPRLPEQKNISTRNPYMQQENFGKTPEGTEVKRYILTNQQGITVKITNYGVL